MLNRKMTTSRVVFPIYGVIAHEITQIGSFATYSPDRAIALARKNFELFECIAKFWLMAHLITLWGYFGIKRKTTEIENGVMNATRPKEGIITPSIAYRLSEWGYFYNWRNL